jgi:hypothetical protein
MLPHSRGMPVCRRQSVHTQSDGKSTRTRAIAGPKPFHSAPTPSAAMVFRAQSKKLEYVPVGADCNLDFKTFIQDKNLLACAATRERTSGGIAIAHMATPAVPPATMTAPIFKSAGEEPAGVRSFFVASYVAKYL